MSDILNSDYRKVYKLSGMIVLLDDDGCMLDKELIDPEEIKVLRELADEVRRHLAIEEATQQTIIVTGLHTTYAKWRELKQSDCDQRVKEFITGELQGGVDDE